MDHMKFLGDSLESIARAKGGIIKPGIPAVLQGQSDIVEREIAKICREQGSRLTVVRRENHTVTHADAYGITMDTAEYHQLDISMPGLFQADNAATAITAVQQLEGFHVSEQAIDRKSVV